jgi:DNA repair exonuclease SbcCD ATPase subunit
VARETAAIAEADADAERLRTRGRAVNARLDDINGQAAAADPLRKERTALDQVVVDADDAIATAERGRRDAETRAARAEANVERLEQVIAERDGIDEWLTASQVQLGRLRKVAAAFGLKGIPARMIESVLPELGRHANDVLSSLFGMSLELRAQRASADGKSTIEALDIVVRSDAAGEHELARISGGQGRRSRWRSRSACRGSTPGAPGRRSEPWSSTSPTAWTRADCTRSARRSRPSPTRASWTACS